MLLVHVLTEDDVGTISWYSNLAVISTIWWQSQHVPYIDFVHHAADHPQCVSSSYLKLPLIVWMLLKQLDKKYDLLFRYLNIFQCFFHSFPSHWQNFVLTAAQDFSSSMLSNTVTHNTFFIDSSFLLVKWQLNSPGNCVWRYAHLDMNEHF